MDEVRNLFDGRRETGSGVRVFAAEFDSGFLDLSMDEGLDFFDGCRQTGSEFLDFSAEFGNFCASIVDISAEGGNGVLLVSL